MSTEPQEYTDKPTGIRPTVEHDNPEHPRVTAHAPESCTLSIEEVNEAIRRLLAQAGIKPPGEQGEQQ